MVCPNAGLFAELCEEVGGLGKTPDGPLLSPAAADWPIYIPQIFHGSRRTTPLEENYVSVPLYVAASRDRRGRFRVRFKSPEAFRNYLRVSGDTKIILTGVGPDQVIEDMWECHKTRGIPEQLAQLGIHAITTPNYSFMRDAARHNSIFNLTRIFRMSERLSEAGIATVPHLNAYNDMDWKRWLAFYREQDHLNFGCVEYQTGARHKEFGDYYFSKLVELRDTLGRSFHPIVVGGSGRFRDFEGSFSAYTIIDATPFMKTMKRQELTEVMDRWKWRRSPTRADATLNGLMAKNIRNYRRWQMLRIGRSPEGEPWQLLLDAA